MTRTRLWLAVAAVAVVPLLAYPLVVVAEGSPSFPGDRGECARRAVDDGGSVEVVAGHVASYDEADALRGRVEAAGLPSAELEQDGCGQWKVAVGVDSYAAGVDTVERLVAAGLDAHVEVAPPG